MTLFFTHLPVMLFTKSQNPLKGKKYSKYHEVNLNSRVQPNRECTSYAHVYFMKAPLLYAV